jgi:cell division protein FtsW
MPASLDNATRSSSQASPGVMRYSPDTGLDATKMVATKMVKGSPHFTLLYITLLLFAMGLTAVYTATGFMAQREDSHFMFSYVLRQLGAGLMGLTAMWVLMRVPFLRWQRGAMTFSLICVALLLITWQFGTTANGSERWLKLGFISLQPSEFAKVAAVMLLAQVASMRGKFWMKPQFFINMLVLGGMIGLIFLQPNLSISLMLGLLTVVMLFVSGFPLTLFGLIGMPTLYLLYHKVKNTEYQWARIIGWLNPDADPQGKGYNLLHSYYAIGSGGFQGVGFSKSIQKLYYLPFQHTDFIFSVWCEELGFIGAVLLIGLFALFGFCGFSIARQCPNRFGQRLAFGLTLTILLQASMNMAVTVGLMPVTGVTLPLISFGGTSVVVTLAMVGILLNISRYRPAPAFTE